MRSSSKTLPKDSNQLAAAIVKLHTEGPEDKPRSAISEYLAEIGRRGGLKGGKIRAEKLSAKRRHQIAQKAAQSRWSKAKKPKRR